MRGTYRRRAPAKLTDAQWERVFDIRCGVRCGHAMTGAERELIERAREEDPQRYAAMVRS